MSPARRSGKWWRLPLALLLVALSVPLLERPAEAAPTWAVPTADGVCVSPVTCVDEAAAALWAGNSSGGIIGASAAFYESYQLIARSDEGLWPGPGPGFVYVEGDYGCTYAKPPLLPRPRLHYDKYEACVRAMNHEIQFQWWLRKPYEEQVSDCTPMSDAPSYCVNLQLQEGDWGSNVGQNILCSLIPLLPACANVPPVEEAWWHQIEVGPMKHGALGPSVMRTVGINPNSTAWAAIIAGNLDEATFGDGPVVIACMVASSVACPGAGWRITITVNTTTNEVSIAHNDQGSNPGGISRVVPFTGWGQSLAIAMRRHAEGDCGTFGCPVNYLHGNEAYHPGWLSWGGARCCSGSGNWSISANAGMATSPEYSKWDVEADLPGWGALVWEHAIPDLLDLQGMVENLGETQGLTYPSWSPSTPEDPFEAPAPPAEPVPWPDAPGPETAPEPAPVPTIPPNDPVTPTTGEEGWFDNLGNRIGGFFDNLSSMIGGAFGWLGGLMADLLQVLLDFLSEMLEWLGSLIEWMANLLADLLRWLGQLLGQILAAIVAMAGLLGGLLAEVVRLLSEGLQGIVNLLGSILGAIGYLGAFIISGLLEGLKDLLEWLFVPQDLSLDGLADACNESFPCSWVVELADGIGGIGGGVTTAAGGSCMTPAIGWAEFQASFPPPPGCGVNGEAEPMGGAASTAGDLWGFRSALRALAFVVAGWVFIQAVIQLTPWAKEEHNRIAPEQQSLI